MLVDTPPELRLQLVREGVQHVDAVWFTHLHADHLHGIDDLRIFSLRSKESVPAYASQDAQSVLERRFDYIFNPSIRPNPGSSKPDISLHTLEAGQPVALAGAPFVPIEVPHGSLRVFGFRVGQLGYVTDAKELPSEAAEALAGVSVMVLNALWWGNPHPTHFNIDEALETASLIGADKTFLTHLTHRVSHEDLSRRLPPGVFAAYDGLSVEIPRGSGADL